jgi:hypothetical protein
VIKQDLADKARTHRADTAKMTIDRETRAVEAEEPALFASDPQYAHWDETGSKAAVAFRNKGKTANGPERGAKTLPPPGKRLSFEEVDGLSEGRVDPAARPTGAG